MTIFSRLLLVAVLAASATGCRSRASVQDAYDARQGTSVIYEVDPGAAYDAALDVLEDEGVDELEEHPRDLHALGGFGMNFVSWGTWVGVWIDPAQGGGSEVTVVTRRKMATNVATVLTETTFHERLRSKLDRRARAASR